MSRPPSPPVWRDHDGTLRDPRTGRPLTGARRTINQRLIDMGDDGHVLPTPENRYYDLTARHHADPEGTRRFVLVRDEDETGISGTGLVAFGVVFPDGVAVTRWNSDVAQTCVWASMDEVEAVHGHGGRTRIEWVDA